MLRRKPFIHPCQTPFSLNPDSDQSRVDASIIYAVANCVDSPLSHPTKLCPLPPRNFEKNVKDPAITPEPWIQDLKWFLYFLGSSNNSAKEKKLTDKKHYSTDIKVRYWNVP